ncbi:DUF2206 domain-containing protein [Natronococcus roseus]|uniref:DUF2206 domain-containing protein n=1 Tax=Natronococcus roseus TaxID=1052014 RepID=UPI00374D14A6
MTDGTETDDSGTLHPRAARVVADLGSDGATVLPGHSATAAVVVLVSVYWASVLGTAVDDRVLVVQSIVGVVLLTIVPGIFVYGLFDRTDGFGEFVLYAVGLGLVFVSVLIVGLEWTVGRFVQPLSQPVFPVALTLAILGLAAVSTYGHRSICLPPLSITRGDVSTVVLFGALPGLAVAAAHAWAVYRQNLLMYVLAVAIGVAVLSYRVIPSRRYPIAIGSIALSTLLHRNLATPSLVGADVQLHYYLATHYQEIGHWTVDFAGENASVPLVTVAPTVFSTVMGVDLTFVFTVVYSCLVALLPVAVYYLVRDPFGTAPAYFGSLFFLFYHGTFYFTPGKEHVSELFVALLLLALVSDRSGPRATTFALLFGFGMIISHYATSFLFIIGLAGCAVLIRLSPSIDRRRTERTITLPFVGVLFALAIGWYWTISPPLIAMLAALPESILEQVSHLVALEFEYLSGGSGAGMVRQQQTELERLMTYLYAGVIALAGIGLLSRTRAELWRGASSAAASSLVCLAIPLYFFLGVSAVAIHDLDADRVFQITMLVLGPFVVLGYGTLYSALRGVRRSVEWGPIVALLLVIFSINVGAVPQLVGQPTDFTFDDEVSDFAYTDEEIEALEWLEQRESLEPAAETGGDSVDVYTDRRTNQLFRAVVPPDYGETKTHLFADTPDHTPPFEDGYVVIRERAVNDDPTIGELTEREQSAIADLESTELVYDNGEMQIYEHRTDANAGSEP